MNKLSSLLKAMLSGGVQLFNYKAKTDNSKRIMPLFLGTLIGIVIFFSANMMTAELAKDGAGYAILSLYCLVTTIIIVLEGSYKASDLLFRPRDNDMLLAMPIKKSTIVLSRIIKFYIFEMIYCLIFLLPAIIAYAVNTEVGPSYFLVAVTMLILVPVIPILAACIIGLVISAVSGRFKHKVLLQVILSFIAMFLILGLVLAINMKTDFDGQQIITISNTITKFYYPASTFVNLATNFHIGEYLAFVVVNIALLSFTVFLISRFYFRIITRINTESRATNTINTKYDFKKHGQTFAMIKKEMTRYFSTPVLLMNTAMGLVLFVIVIGLLCFKFDDMAASLISSTESFPLTINDMRAFMPSVTFAMVAFASLLTCITATMISLEGKAFNTLKVLPISGKKVIWTKVLSAILLIIPITLVGCFIMCFRFEFGFLDMILVLIGTVAMPLVTELIGILINLKYPRFDADNDTVVVRQSASVMVSTFLGLGMVLTTISLTFVVVLFAGQTAGLAIMDAIYVVISAYLLLVIATRGEEKYLKLSA